MATAVEERVNLVISVDPEELRNADNYIVDVIDATNQDVKVLEVDESGTDAATFNVTGVVATASKRQYQNPNAGFSFGLDLSDPTRKEKRLERAKRFGLSTEEIEAQERRIADLESLYNEMGLTADLVEEHRAYLRLSVIHLRGVDDLATENIFQFFEGYEPQSVEWIDDTSCNVVWDDNNAAAHALIYTSQSLASKLAAERAAKEKENIPTPTAEGVTAAADGETAEAMESEDQVEIVAADETLAGDLDVTTLSDDDEEEEEGEEHAKLVQKWRSATFKTNELFMRFATCDDKKQRGAEKRSKYYQRHGNPNFSHMRGIISSTKREEKISRIKERQLAHARQSIKGFALRDRDDVASELMGMAAVGSDDEFGEEQIAESGAEEDVEEGEASDGEAVVQTSRSIKERLGTFTVKIEPKDENVSVKSSEDEAEKGLRDEISQLKAAILHSQGEVRCRMYSDSIKTAAPRLLEEDLSYPGEDWAREEEERTYRPTRPVRFQSYMDDEESWKPPRDSMYPSHRDRTPPIYRDRLHPPIYRDRSPRRRDRSPLYEERYSRGERDIEQSYRSARELASRHRDTEQYSRSRPSDYSRGTLRSDSVRSSRRDGGSGRRVAKEERREAREERREAREERARAPRHKVASEITVSRPSLGKRSLPETMEVVAAAAPPAKVSGAVVKVTRTPASRVSKPTREVASRPARELSSSSASDSSSEEGETSSASSAEEMEEKPVIPQLVVQKVEEASASSSGSGSESSSGSGSSSSSSSGSSSSEDDEPTPRRGNTAARARQTGSDARDIIRRRRRVKDEPS